MDKQSNICKPNAHDFVPKRQEHVTRDTNYQDITSVYCKKCGTVCFLQPQPETESRISLARQ